MSPSIRTTKFALIGALCLAAFAAIGVERHQVSKLQEDNAAMALQHTNDVAALDTTRKVSATNAQLAHALGDSVAMVQKLVVQVTQQGDSVDHALKLERRGKYSMGISVDSLQRVIASRSAVTEDTDHVRRASFDVRQAPYTVTAAVELPPVPDTARLDLRIALDPIPVTARLSCAPPNDHGIRDASIEASAPKWAAIRFDQVSQSPDLCASPALAHANGRRFIRFAPLVIGGGMVASSVHRTGWAGFVGSGFAFGG
jgi:hypothetical protein